MQRAFSVNSPSNWRDWKSRVATRCSSESSPCAGCAFCGHPSPIFAAKPSARNSLILASGKRTPPGRPLPPARPAARAARGHFLRARVLRTTCAGDRSSRFPAAAPAVSCSSCWQEAAPAQRHAPWPVEPENLTITDSYPFPGTSSPVAFLTSPHPSDSSPLPTCAPPAHSVHDHSPFCPFDPSCSFCPKIRTSERSEPRHSSQSDGGPTLPASVVPRFPCAPCIPWAPLIPSFCPKPLRSLRSLRLNSCLPSTAACFAFKITGLAALPFRSQRRR